MANSKIKYEELPEAAQKAVRKISRIRKITHFISLALGAMAGVYFASRISGAASKVGMFIAAFALFCGMLQGAVHGIKVYKRLIRQHSIVGVFLSVIAMTCYAAVGGIFLAADILLFITRQPLVYLSEYSDILSVGGNRTFP